MTLRRLVSLLVAVVAVAGLSALPTTSLARTSGAASLRGGDQPAAGDSSSDDPADVSGDDQGDQPDPSCDQSSGDQSSGDQSDDQSSDDQSSGDQSSGDGGDAADDRSVGDSVDGSSAADPSDAPGAGDDQGDQTDSTDQGDDSGSSDQGAGADQGSGSGDQGSGSDDQGDDSGSGDQGGDDQGDCPPPVVAPVADGGAVTPTGTVTETVVMPGPGDVVASVTATGASGRAVASASARRVLGARHLHVTHRGTFTVHVKLNRQARKALRRATSPLRLALHTRIRVSGHAATRHTQVLTVSPRRARRH